LGGSGAGRWAEQGHRGRAADAASREIVDFKGAGPSGPSADPSADQQEHMQEKLLVWVIFMP
jgi:hypothetical protein